MSKTTVHYLGSKSSSVFLPLLCEFVLLHIVFALRLSDVSWLRFASQIVLRYLLARLLEDPVVLVIILVTTLVHQVFEDFSHVVIVWSLLELEVSAVLKILVEFFRQTSSKRLNSRRHFLIFDSIVFVILIFALQSLPR